MLILCILRLQIMAGSMIFGSLFSTSCLYIWGSYVMRVRLDFRIKYMLQGK